MIDAVKVTPVALAALVTATISLQYILLKTNWVPQMIAGIVPVIAFAVIPFIFTCEPKIIFVTLTGYVMTALLRCFDIAMQPRKVVQRWTAVDYFTYFWTYSTDEQRNHRLDVLKKKKDGLKPSLVHSLDTCVVPRDQMDAIFFKNWTKRLVVSYCMYHVSLYYVFHYFDVTDALTLTKWTVKSFFDQISYGTVLYTHMNVGFSLLYMFLSLTFNIPYVEIMHNPFSSVGLRDFWSNRWNFTVQQSLKNIVFTPSMALLSRMSPNRKPGFRPPQWHMVVASFATFVFSAVFHEWVFAAMVGFTSEYEHLVFFIVHGVLTIFEVGMRKIIHNRFGFDPLKAFPPFVVEFSTVMLFLCFANLFTSPFVRHKVLQSFRLPMIIDVSKPLNALL